MKGLEPSNLVTTAHQNDRTNAAAQIRASM